MNPSVVDLPRSFSCSSLTNGSSLRAPGRCDLPTRLTSEPLPGYLPGYRPAGSSPFGEWAPAATRTAWRTWMTHSNSWPIALSVDEVRPFYFFFFNFLLRVILGCGTWVQLDNVAKHTQGVRTGATDVAGADKTSTTRTHFGVAAPDYCRYLCLGLARAHIPDVDGERCNTEMALGGCKLFL
ncbi:hypothetical protein DFH06DRAFT_1293903 [Mycena polygramma]|nr:hypothetical protein DFH06DRAFT_1293903 [Mycena polygramma]